jgi:hypothetical protein
MTGRRRVRQGARECLLVGETVRSAYLPVPGAGRADVSNRTDWAFLRVRARGREQVRDVADATNRTDWDLLRASAREVGRRHGSAIPGKGLGWIWVFNVSGVRRLGTVAQLGELVKNNTRTSSGYAPRLPSRIRWQVHGVDPWNETVKVRVSSLSGVRVAGLLQLSP